MGKQRKVKVVGVCVCVCVCRSAERHVQPNVRPVAGVHRPLSRLRDNVNRLGGGARGGAYMPVNNRHE